MATRAVMQGVVGVREFYKFAAAEQFVDGSVLAALYQVADRPSLARPSERGGRRSGLRRPAAAPGQTCSPGGLARPGSGGRPVANS